MQSTPPEKADARLHFSAIPTSCDCLSNSGHPAETSCLQGDITGGGKDTQQPLTSISVMLRNPRRRRGFSPAPLLNNAVWNSIKAIIRCAK